MEIKEMIFVIKSRYKRLLFEENTTARTNPDRTKQKNEEKSKVKKGNQVACKGVVKDSKKPQREIAEKEYDIVRSRHSTREGDGTSARWRWRVACLPPCCPRAGLSYDKADRLIHHVTRQAGCRTFWEGQMGKEEVDILVKAHKTNTSWSDSRTTVAGHGFP